MLKYKAEINMYDNNDSDKGYIVGTYKDAASIIKVLKINIGGVVNRINIKITAIQEDNIIYIKDADIFIDWTIDIIVKKFFRIK